MVVSRLGGATWVAGSYHASKDSSVGLTGNQPRFNKCSQFDCGILTLK